MDGSEPQGQGSLSVYGWQAGLHQGGKSTVSLALTAGLLEYTLLCFTALFAMINPFGIAPVFKPSPMVDASPGTSHRSPSHSYRLYHAAVVFALAGKRLCSISSAVSVNSLKIVGGIIFLHAGARSPPSQAVKMKHDNILPAGELEQLEEYSKDIAITPACMLILCGPGAIANVIIFMHDGPTLSHKLGLILSMMAVLSLNYVGLIGASRLLHLLGDSGIKVVMRIWRV